MAKTLSESAAEILRASQSAAGKEPMLSMGAEVQDLGGQTPQQPPSAIGAAASAKVAVAPKPGVEGAPAEPMKAAPQKAKKIGDEDEALKKNPVDAGAVRAEDTEFDDESVIEEEGEQSPEETKAKKLLKPGQKIGAMKLGEASKDDEDEEDDDEDEDEDEKDEKSMKEDYVNQTKKDLIEKYRGSMREDVDALFNGESLSEDFRVKATLIFESAVQSRVEKIVEDVLSENDQVLAVAIEEIKSELTEQVDQYLNYVVEEWVSENELAIETGLRSELAEDFINGLKNLFAEHYMEIPEDKVDVTEELASVVAELEEAYAAEAEEKESILQELNTIKKEKAIARMCEGLTAVQAEKMKSLAEGVEFTAEGDFDNKLAVLRENYFPNKVNVKSEVKVLQERNIEEPEVAEISNSIMARYVQSITKTAPKA